MKDTQQPEASSEQAERQDGRSSQKITRVADLLLDQLRDVYSVELQLIPAFTELETLAASEPLRRHFQRQVEETRRQKERLEEIGRSRDWDLSGDKSKAMEGLIAGGRAHVIETDFPPARDYLITAHTRRIKRYEVAAYDVTIALADRLGLSESVLLQASLEEERQLAESLTRLSTELLETVPSP